MNCWVIILVTIGCATDAYKFLVYSPLFGYSHTNYMGAIADSLTEAGHDVTMLMPVLDPEETNKTGVKLTKKIIKLPPEPRSYELVKYQAEVLANVWTMQPSIFALLQMSTNFTRTFAYTCEGVFNNEQLIRSLSLEKFDVGISEVFCICGFGVFELLGIPASIATLSSGYMDIVSLNIGEPITPSYVPGGLSTKGDRMGFFDRLRNTIDGLLGRKFFSQTFDREIAAFRAKFGPQFKGYEELLAESSYVFTNSNPYLDYPRPMLHKTVSIGGITVVTDTKRNSLSKEWDSILSEKNTTVLVSFGSVAKSIYMPDKYKNTLLKVFASMPETTFIWKYEEEGSQIAAHLKNVHLSTWLPQNALLADPRLTAFVTHGGLGSTTELAHMGKPAIIIPIFADQTRNAHMLAKHGGGIVLTKFDLEHPQLLIDSLTEIFNDARFTSNAKRLSEMLLNPPITAKEVVVRHCEFTAEFGRLPNLDPYGRHLTYIQYFLIDVIFLVLSIVFVIVGVVAIIIKKCLLLRVKSKKE